jgi:hypothetical protein
MMEFDAYKWIFQCPIMWPSLILQECT